MGNTFNTDNLMKEYEHVSGKRLLRAIRANHAGNVKESIEAARKELLSGDRRKSHDEDYDNMVRKMTTYLTRQYDVGDGMLFGKTPLELAASVGSDQATEAINEELAILSKNKASSEILERKGASVSQSTALGKVDKDRAVQARERLKEFKRQYEEKKATNK